MRLNLPSLHIQSDQVQDVPPLWMLLAEYPFMIDGKMFWIPLFFVCDKYSVLGIVLKKSRKNEKENIPAWLHDYVIRNRNILGFSMMDCHWIFLQAMKLCGIGFFMRWAKYLAVVNFNWMLAGDGNGTPPKDVQAFIDKHGYGC